jgi:hypothetical protein
MYKSNPVYLLLGICLSLMAACNYQEGSREVRSEAGFAMDIPHYMEEYDELLPGSDLQYANRFRNLYVVANRTNTDTFQAGFEAFTQTELNRLMQVLDDPVVYDSMTSENNGLYEVKMEIFGQMGKEMIYYHLKTIRAADTYYFVCIWTRGESRWNTYKTDMNNILSSFRLSPA